MRRVGAWSIGVENDTKRHLEVSQLTRPVHPFPARMAPGLALDTLKGLKPQSVVLDPMSGSGTVLRQAADMGHRAVGFDLDPLAVLMAKVWTTPVEDDAIQAQYDLMQAMVADLVEEDATLPWIDDDAETKAFVSYWFGDQQSKTLRKLAFAINVLKEQDVDPEVLAAINVLSLNLSRIIVTKEQAASLARDTSHSRPHRVALTSDFDVLQGFGRSLNAVRKRLSEAPPTAGAAISRGDARAMGALEADSIDAVITSPPYLNAIDYLRGHRMSLIWLGWKLGDLRAIRSASIGAERAPDAGTTRVGIDAAVAAMVDRESLAPRHRGMIDRYAADLLRMMSEVGRVLRPGGKATFVVGNSCLKGAFVKNADGVAHAAAQCGLTEISRSERNLPLQNRYLPVTGEALAKRMRTETVLTFLAA